MRRWTAILLTLLLTAMLGTAGGGSVAVAGPSEGEMTARVQHARYYAGLNSYTVAPDLVAMARRHSAEMASRRSVYHNPRLTDACCWTVIGENVGSGADARVIHDAFMRSSPHRANILSTRFLEVGIGTAVGADGRLYVTEVFRRR